MQTTHDSEGNLTRFSTGNLDCISILGSISIYIKDKHTNRIASACDVSTDEAESFALHLLSLCETRRKKDVLQK